MSPVRLPAVEHPDVSVVVVAYGAGEWILRTVDALVRHTAPRYELIVVDNASPDGTGDLLERELLGARVLRQDRNLGFGVGNDLGAAHARAPWLLLLNPDVEVTPGWLEPLLAAAGRPGVGAAAPRFLHPDGRLQEAGSVLGRDGSTQALGDGDDPDSPVYRFPRRADYVSAACLLLRRRTFLEVGGFDAVFRPAYCEDVDLALALDEHGLATVYEPRSVVRHARSVSAGGPAEAARLMVAHRAIIQERWGHVLADRPSLDRLDELPHRRWWARDARHGDRLLVIDDRVPHFDKGAGDTRASLVLEELVRLVPEGRITLLASAAEGAERYAPRLLDLGVEVVVGHRDWLPWFEERRFLYTCVMLSRPNNFGAFEPLLAYSQPQAGRIYDAEALYSRRLEREAELATDPGEAARLRDEADHTRAVEVGAMSWADVVLTVTPEEAAVAERVAPHALVRLLPDVLRVRADRPGFDERRDLVFFGGFLGGPGSPNEDALLHLVDDVLPVFWAWHPEVRLHVVGADPTPAVRRLEGDRIRVVGGVADPGEWLARFRVHAAPMRFGAGVKRKLLDTMAAGLPFVTSTVGAEGLRLGELTPWLVADDPGEQAWLLHRLYTERPRWEAARDGVVARCRRWFGPDRFAPTLAEALSWVGVAPTAPPGGPRRSHVPG